MPQWLLDLWNWTKENDLPEWWATGFTAVLWPVVLFAWNRRRVNNVVNLEVRLFPGTIQINGTSHSAVGMEFINHSGSVVYLAGVRLRPNQKTFPVPIDASRDIAEGTHHMSFMDGSGEYVDREVTLQTNEKRQSCMAISSTMPEAFYTFKAPWYRRVIRKPKYFLLEYTVMVGVSRHSVATVY